MHARIDATKYLHTGMAKAMFALSNETKHQLDPRLAELVKIRASQINLCAYCIDMHTKDARAAGETEQRIYALSAWRETPFFTPRERIALEWTETLTRLAGQEIPDDIRARVMAEFAEPDFVALTFAIVVINAWNRISRGFEAEAGTYQPAKATASV